jgi:hypothetical protein
MDFRIVAERLGSGDGLCRMSRGIFRIEGRESDSIMEKRPLAEAGRDLQNFRTHGQSSETNVRTVSQANALGHDKVRARNATRSNSVVTPVATLSLSGSWSRGFPLQNHVALTV